MLSSDLSIFETDSSYSYVMFRSDGYVSLNGRYFNRTYPLTEKIRDTRCMFDYKANPELGKIFVHSDNGEFKLIIALFLFKLPAVTSLIII